MTAPAASVQPDLVTVNIDGHELAVPRGTNMIEAARLVGVDIPHYCYHPKLAVVGNCRMCLVEMGLPAVDPATKQPLVDPATGRQKINWMPRPQIGCGTNATPGLHIRTNSPLVKDCREGVTEFLLINHPLDCPICDQAGECHLQEQATAYGRGYSRFVEQKNVKPKRTQLGPRVMLDDERCILCSRCIRFSRDIAKQDVLGFIDRGSYSTLTCHPGHQLEHNYSLNTVDICPVGALTSTDFRFKMRVWFLKQTNSIDTESSAGVNTTVWSREGQIYRITPRRNDDVNDTWMPDSGRVLYKQVRAENRLTAIKVNGQPASLDAAIAAAAELLKTAAPGPQSQIVNRKSEIVNSLALVASTRSTVEEQYLAKKLADALALPAAARHLPAHLAEGDGLLLTADRSPNTRGALLTGLADKLPSPALATLAADIDSGRIDTLLVINEDLTAAGLTAAQLARVRLIYIGTHANPTSDAAQIVLPARTVFEKNGSFINQQFRLQRFEQAIPGLAGTTDDLVLLARLLAAAENRPDTESGINAIWRRLAADAPVFAGIEYATISAGGLPLVPGTLARLAFPEGESLHYKTTATTAAP
ncbi:2Fe-2S iron-sulfur cluster-binding protein [Termitidicoccus mucosus]|uniref:Ferredoxin n=1 Tax=Termitidicoccus mucosus TaxID=1184151 RepID=A0A178ILZ1_9BACT|nr:ferredoxin [Opitutaceae bacterium TSB47]